MLKSLFRSTRLVAKQAVQASQARDPNFIDVRQLIAELSDEELMRSADAYFSRMTLASEQCRKPWGNPQDAVHQTRHLGLVLEAADLFRGAAVLDFGCATGWLTLGLAQMGCNAIGVDIAPNAVRLAERLSLMRLPAHGGGSLAYRVYDGHRLPLEDATLDRVICYDAFHHVRDQRATLAEFARVLKPGGRAAFIEPGPDHSKTPQSQAEMARYKVIENDVSMEEITRHAVDLGFEKPRLLVQFAQPFVVEADDFNAWARDGIARDWSARAMAQLDQQLTNGQCFFIVRRGATADAPDSRRADGLAGQVEVLQAFRLPAAQGQGIRLEVRVTNTGQAHWRDTAGAGQVNLGIQVADARGQVVDNNFARLKLPPGGVAPGQSAIIQGIVRVPPEPDARLRLDLVSELVTWFADLKGQQAVLVQPEDARRA